MLDLAIPALYALLVWWLSTGIVLCVVRLPRRTYRTSLAFGAALAAAALAAIATTADMRSPMGAYLAFTAAILVWGFVELTFLTGFVTGPNRLAGSPATNGWARARHATAAIIHHELALVAAGVLIFTTAYAGANKVALWTFAVLWLMRLSAKLNLFLGVPNLHDELMPEHLAHLRSHFRRSAMNPLLPVSIVLPLIVAGCLVVSATGDASAFALTSHALLAALLALAALEHVFMLLPLPVMNLWNWGQAANHGPGPSAPASAAEPLSIRPHHQEASVSITRRRI